MPETIPETWAILELMGHVKVAGRISEEEKYGCKMGRIDIPTSEPCACKNANKLTVDQATVPCEKCNGAGFVLGFITQYFGGASVYRISLVSEDVARHVAATNRAQPVSSWDFPKRALPAPEPPTFLNDRVMSCGHTPENCDCESDDEYDEDEP